ncbi:MAG: hypothetical protein ABFC96_03935 [Thermoguttaceae bacterium]
MASLPPPLNDRPDRLASACEPAPRRRLAACIADWCREDGYWYLTSAAVHAVGLLLLAMISLHAGRAVQWLGGEAAPAFEAAKVDNTRQPEVAPFEVGEAPLDPTELNAETLAQSKARPAAAQTAKYYDDSPTFEEAGGGTSADMTGPKLGGLGGLSVRGLPGPGGRGGVGVGTGTGDNAGSGGDGLGLGSRGKGHRDALVGAWGGTRASERAVGAALNWLYRHQSKQGKWSLDYRAQCKDKGCSGASAGRSDGAATALALLPFLAAGQTHKSKGPYKDAIAKGLAWLMKHQRPDGDLSAGDGFGKPMYAHGLATIVLCEAYGMSRDEHVGTAARAALGFIQRAQSRSTGGWRYHPGDAGDTSVFGWQIMALKSGVLANLPVESLTFDNGQKWLRSVASGDHLGLYAYRPYESVSPTMTAVGMLCRQYMGINPKDPGMLEGKQALLENLPDAKGARDTYYWYYATLVMHNFGDADWDRWNRKMRRTLIETQVKDGCGMGSWDPERPTPDHWGQEGGRLMTTSLSTLTLEVYYRYLPLFRNGSRQAGSSNRMGFSEPIGKPDAE